MLSLLEQDICFVGMKPAKGSVFRVEIRYEMFNAFCGYFYISSLFRKIIRESKKIYPYGHLVLQQEENIWNLIWEGKEEEKIFVGNLDSSAFASLEKGWTDISSRTFPLKEEMVSKKDGKTNSVLWIRYHGMTFYKTSNDKYRKLILGLVTGEIICPEDEKTKMVLVNPEQYEYSRNGYDWNACPKDIRRLTAPRQCVFTIKRE